MPDTTPSDINTLDAQSLWPFQLSIDDEAFPNLQLFDKPLNLRLRSGSTLEITQATPESSRLAGLPKTSQSLVFLPSFGTRPLLLFPRPQLICPAGMTLEVQLGISMRIQLSVNDGQRNHLLMEWLSPYVSRGAYGPVDSALICSSHRCPVASSKERFPEATPEHPIFRSEFRYHYKDESTHILPVWASVPLTVTNNSTEPLEVSKIMAPTTNLSLFQNLQTGQLTTNPITMHLHNAGEAELAVEAPTGPQSLWRLITGPGEQAFERRPYVFLHAYRTKTGLEHGF